MLDELPKLIPRNQPYHPLHRKDGIGLPFLPVVRGVVVRIKRIASRNLLATPTVSPLIIFHSPIITNPPLYQSIQPLASAQDPRLLRRGYLGPWVFG